MKIKKLFVHKTKSQVLLKFIILLAIFAAYFIYLTMKFDFATGGLVAFLTWSFFVLATPVADAGFLLDFPLRLVTGIRMFISEIFVWIVAILLNIFALAFYPHAYEKTILTSFLKKIIITPYPYWTIIILSGIGTFLSIRFADELVDVAKHKDRHLFHKHGFKLEIIVFIAIITLVIFAYHHLLKSLGVTFLN